MNGDGAVTATCMATAATEHGELAGSSPAMGVEERATERSTAWDGEHAGTAARREDGRTCGCGDAVLLCLHEACARGLYACGCMLEPMCMYESGGCLCICMHVCEEEEACR